MNDSVTMSIRIPKQLYQEIKRRAAEEEKSIAQVLRDAAAQYVASSSSSPLDTLWLIGSDPVDFGITDASVNYDDYLYGPLSESAKAEMMTQSVSSPKHSSLSR